MTIRHLKIFITVYEQLNITHAARELHMTQPVVTRTIKELEHYYGAQLFERMNRKLYVTDAGRRFYAHAKQVVDSFDFMERDVRNEGESFTLRIGSTFYLGSCLLPRVLVDFQRLYPKARLKAHVFNAGNLQRALCSNELDLALIEDQVVNPNLNSEPFFQDQLVLILPTDHPLLEKETLRMQELRDAPFLVREKGSFGRQRFDEAFASHDITIDPLLESCSTQAIIQSVHAGLGLALLPEHLVKDCIDSGLVAKRPIADESLVRKNYIVWHKGKFLSQPLLNTIDLCRKAARDLGEQTLSP